MKKLLFTLTFGLAIVASPAAFAQAKKKEPAAPAAAPAGAPAADAKKPEAKAAKPLPMNARADEIDAAGKTFTQVNKDGKKVKHVISDATEIKNGEAAAKFEDIKVGDTVAGLRNKKNADGTEYEVVKITKFGPKAPKADKPAEKPAEKPAKK
ncbi:MAG: hypothetical protein RL088_2059 [Verrucomicrobiota bacterium]|jgi:hypothetical protein